MSYVHHEKELVYLAHPATASTATRTALIEIGFEQLGSHHAGNIPHRYFPFTTVRNHWDALVSWAYKVTRKDAAGAVAFIDTDWLTWLFTNHPYFYPEKLWFHHQPGTHAIKFENLQTDLEKHLQIFELKCPTIPIENENKFRMPIYEDLFDPRAIDLIQWLWGKEITELDYRLTPGAM